jgi:hypothetical protein
MMTKPSPNIEYLQHPHTYIHRQIAIGKRLVIMAEADDGELYNPLLVYNRDMAIDFFGGGDLIRLYEDATTFEEGLDIYLMRIESFGQDLAFSVLEAFEFDILFMNEMHFNKDKEFIKSFLEFATIKEEKGQLIQGITTLSSDLVDTSFPSVFEDIKDLTVEIGDEYIETGKYLSIVLNQSLLKDSGAVYAGILASLGPEESPINKTIPEFTLDKELSKEEIEQLRSAGVVCFRNTFKKGVTCASSSCAVSTEGSVHKHISNFRIAQALINQLTVQIQSFVGKPHVMLQAENIDIIVDSTCLDQMSMKRIRDYDYSLSVSELYGTIELKVEIVPIFSVHSMTTHSRVRIFK